MQNPQKYPTKGKRGNPMHDELIKNLRNCSEINSLSRYKRDLMKQAADAIEELQKDLERSKDFEAFWQHEAEEALKKFQVAISNKPKWIPVTERLPKECGSYLIADGRIVMEGLYEKIWGDDLWTDPGEMYMTYHPTHWMPLPQPPESGDSLSCGIRKNFQQKSTVDNGACFNGEPSEKVQGE